jgi:hypothetical protein
MRLFESLDLFRQESLHAPPVQYSNMMRKSEIYLRSGNFNFRQPPNDPARVSGRQNVPDSGPFVAELNFFRGLCIGATCRSLGPKRVEGWDKSKAKDDFLFGFG